jgi:Flp pilus assembly protein TadD
MSDVNVADRLAEAIRHQQAGRFTEARQLYEEILAVDPTHAQAMHLLGTLIALGQDVPRALQLMRRAIELAPNIAGFHYNLGMVWARVERWPEAASEFQRAGELDPQNADSLLNLGNALYNLGNLEEAITTFEKSIAIKPGSARAHRNLAEALRLVGRFVDALKACRTAQLCEPRSAEILSELSFHLANCGKLDESIAAAEAALRIKPNFLLALNNMVVAYLAGGRVEEALAAAQRAIKVEQNVPTLRWNLACALLRSGRLLEGFAEHEHRATGTGAVSRTWQQPRWDGRELRDERILVYADQGIGDMMFFARYLPMVAGRGGRMILECQQPLVRLLRQMPGIELVIGRGEEMPPFDCQAPVGSLPMVFRTTMETIPAEVPYIGADADLSGQWKQRLSGGSGGAGLKIGLCWGGNPRNTYNHFRSMTAADLAPILAAGSAAGVSFFSLQKGPAAATVGGSSGDAVGARGGIGGVALVDYTSELKDFAETAALIDNLDLVISVDTAVAHLAGAMGKATWVPLSTAADWRYFTDREDSPWYPTMRLFRQKKLGDWGEPVARVARALRDLASGKRS